MSIQMKIEESGPWRAIGMSCMGKGGSSEMSELWRTQMGPRMGEIRRPASAAAFGICRCIPGVTDGSFEYIAAAEATADSDVPAGMMELVIPRCHYAIMQVNSLAEIGEAWRQVQSGAGQQPGWEPYCGPKGCECASHPCFEFYASTFMEDGKLALCIPVERVP